MTNAEKYLKDGISDTEIWQAYVEHCQIHKRVVDSTHFFKFFEEEAITLKPTLTEDERVILRNIRNDAFGKYIGRGDGIRENTPTYYNLYLRGDGETKAYAIGTIYNHLFQFIKERRRIRDSRIIRRWEVMEIIGFDYGSFLIGLLLGSFLVLFLVVLCDYFN